VLKPSEVSANVANALTDLFPKYLDPNTYAVVNGAVPETSYLLSLKWDFILFTGGCEIGKIVASAAAKHVTPCALELGGTSPTVIADDADLDLAAKRILWGYVFLVNLCRMQKRLNPLPQKETEWRAALRFTQPCADSTTSARQIRDGHKISLLDLFPQRNAGHSGHGQNRQRESPQTSAKFISKLQGTDDTWW